jgi:hypothetical protein
VADLCISARCWSVSAGPGIAVAFMAFFVSSIFVMSLLLQSGLGLTPLEGGLSFGPFCIAAVITALAGRRLIARFGAPAVIRVGSAISATGTTLVGVGVALATQGASVSVGWLVAGLGIVGAGDSLLLTRLPLCHSQRSTTWPSRYRLRYPQHLSSSSLDQPASRSSAPCSSPSWATTPDPITTPMPQPSSFGSGSVSSSSWLRSRRCWHEMPHLRTHQNRWPTQVGAVPAPDTNASAHRPPPTAS